MGGDSEIDGNTIGALNGGYFGISNRIRINALTSRAPSVQVHAWIQRRLVYMDNVAIRGRDRANEVQQGRKPSLYINGEHFVFPPPAPPRLSGLQTRTNKFMDTVRSAAWMHARVDQWEVRRRQIGSESVGSWNRRNCSSEKAERNGKENHGTAK